MKIPFLALRGLLKDVFAELGGGEALRRERASFYYQADLKGKAKSERPARLDRNCSSFDCRRHLALPGLLIRIRKS